MKSYAFFFHYNKPLSQRVERVQMSVHYRGTCYICDRVVCRATCTSRSRSSQPRLVMAGKARGLTAIESPEGLTIEILE